MYTIEKIATIYTDFISKFGIPRQSGLIEGTYGKIVFEPKYRDKNALKGIEDFSHLWLLWIFSENVNSKWSPTVRPPRLGGNKRMGVFATRSPFRPNNIGLSSVKLVGIEESKEEGTVLIVSGADLLNGTPIIDIKPYLPFTDSHQNAVGGFADGVKGYKIKVNIPEALKKDVDENTLTVIEELLSNDPRPSYQNDEDRIYAFEYGKYKIKFNVSNGELNVIEIS